MPKKASRPDAQVSSKHRALPAWPRLTPLVPVEDLELEVALPDQVVLVKRFFTRALCQSYVKFLANLPLTTTPGKPKKGEATRVNDRFQVSDPDFARLLYEATSLKYLIENSEQDWGGKVIGLNSNIRIYRYSPGQFFDQHYDESNDVILPTTPITKAKTTWTVLLYLTDSTTGCQGGETVFWPEPTLSKRHKPTANLPLLSLAPELGMVLLHKHGDDCLLHEGREVMAGEKWVIRSDLCVSKV